MTQATEIKSYYIESYGCQMNLYDADIMASILERSGYRPSRALEEADVILVNTCSVREHAEQRAMGRIRELAGLKRNRPGARLAVCGCMAQRMGQEILGLIPGIDLVVGTDSYKNLPKLLAQADGLRTVETSVCAQQSYSQIIPRYRGGVSAFVAVMRGCDNRCTYCVVPALRGPARSRPLKQILQEVKGFVVKGCREVTFLGQNVNAYRDGHRGLQDLLRKADQLSGLYRIRFITSHPRDMDQEILLAMADCQNVCEHLHLPLQSGSDKILRAMRRGYTAEEYRSLVQRAREILPGVSITTDLIAGFPGESEKDFRETLRLMRDVEFDDAFTFAYSHRPGTAAGEKKNQVPLGVRQGRLERLISLQREITHKLNQGLVGHTEEVLVESRSKRNIQELTGRTRTNKVVNFPGGQELIGTLVKVRVKRAQSGTAWGQQASGNKFEATRRAEVKRNTISLPSRK